MINTGENQGKINLEKQNKTVYQCSLTIFKNYYYDYYYLDGT